MSFVRDQCAIMSQLQIDMARELASVPPSLSPPGPLPTTKANDSHSEPVLPFVSQADEE